MTRNIFSHEITRNGKNKSFYREPAVVTVVDMITKLCRHAF